MIRTHAHVHALIDFYFFPQPPLLRECGRASDVDVRRPAEEHTKMESWGLQQGMPASPAPASKL
eukprot:559348-Amphidinium_carterae.1